VTESYGEYKRPIKDGKKHSQGVKTCASGEKYDGEWRDGKMHGHGVFTYANGDKYGMATYSNGHKYDGEWRNDKMHGHGGFVGFGGMAKTITHFCNVLNKCIIVMRNNHGMGVKSLAD